MSPELARKRAELAPVGRAGAQLGATRQAAPAIPSSRGLGARLRRPSWAARAGQDRVLGAVPHWVVLDAPEWFGLGLAKSGARAALRAVRAFRASPLRGAGLAMRLRQGWQRDSHIFAFNYCLFLCNGCTSCAVACEFSLRPLLFCKLGCAGGIGTSRCLRRLRASLCALALASMALRTGGRYDVSRANKLALSRAPPRRATRCAATIGTGDAVSRVFKCQRASVISASMWASLPLRLLKCDFGAQMIVRGLVVIDA